MKAHIDPLPNDDLIVTCVDCGYPFTFTVAERAFYRSKQLTIPPKRCKPCLADRRARLVPDRRADA